MKSTKPPAAEASSSRRAQPVRQTRTNPPRSSANGRAAGREAMGGALGDQSINIFPAITHFADAITALPKELVRHFTLMKEVDAKLSIPEAELFRLVEAAAKAPLPEPRPNNDAANNNAPGSAPMSAQNSSTGTAPGAGSQAGPAVDDAQSHKDLVFDPSNLPRRHLYRQTALKIQEMLVSLEEKNHVISTANETLRAQLTRIDDVWPDLENEFSDETKWGSTNHWAYPENRIGRSAQADRARRDGAAAISAAAQALAEEAAARSDARKQAVQAKKNSRNHNNTNNHHQESDFDDHSGQHKNEGKKNQATKSRKREETNNVGLGITTPASTSTANPPQKRRKVEKTTNGATTERAMGTVFGTTAPKPKTTSPRATPAPEGPKKRKALPSGSGQSKKGKNGTAGLPTSATSSPVITELPEPKPAVRASPAPGAAPVPVPTRARKNSVQSANAESVKGRPSSSASNKANGATATAPEATAQPSTWPQSIPEAKEPSEPVVPIKTEVAKKDAERQETTVAATPATTKKETKADENDRKSESVPPTPQTATVTTKSGRASKPSTPALATFQEALRARSSRNIDGNGGNKKNQKKANSTIHAIVNPQRAGEGGIRSRQGDDDDGEIDADEPTYCYCNSVSYGEMVACDADGCPREWFHLECVGLKVAPGSKAKWYCEDCKERLKTSGKKVNGR